MSFAWNARRTAAAWALAAAACAAGVSACRQKDPVLARVGSETVTAGEFQRELSSQPFSHQDYMKTPAGRKELLELLIRRKIVMAEARRSGLTDKPEIKKRLADIEAELQRQRDQARERVVVAEFFRGLQQKDLKVPEEDVRRFWQTEKEVRASHILVSDETKAREIKSRLDKGESFEALARKHSEDVPTGRRGGDLGYLMKGALVPEFESVLWGLKVGETSGVAKSPFGFHVIRKTAERPLSEKPFEQVAEAARSVIEKKKFQDWIEAARGRQTVTTDDRALEKMTLPPSDSGPSAAVLPQKP